MCLIAGKSEPDSQYIPLKAAKDMNESIPNDIRQGRPLNRDIIKYIAMFTMTLNHLSLTGFIGNYELAKQFTYIGYFTLITMTYFLVEGFAYTRDRMKYGRRLLLFAVLSEAPFLYALKIAPGESFSSDQVELNVIFNLFFCFLILTALESAQTAGMKILEIAVLFIGSAMSDWSVMAPAFTLIFYFSAHGWKKPCPHMNGIPYGTARARREKIGYLLCLLFFIICTSLMSAVYLLSLRGNGIDILYLFDPESISGPLLSFLVICFLYNGKRMRHGKAFSKWFFYIYYPAHLAVIALILHLR